MTIRFKWTSKLLLYLFLGAYTVMALIPFLWALSTSFKTKRDSSVTSDIQFIPPDFTFEAYEFILSQGDQFMRWLFNSVVIAVAVVLCNLLFNSMAGYALARLRFFGRGFWFALVLAILMVPPQVTIIPQYLILKELSLLNSYEGMVLPMAVNATFIFMMRQFFINFNAELEEAALLDGLKRFGIFFRIVLPLAGPALAAQAIFTFLGSWNNFMMPLIILSENSMYTLPLGLNSFQGRYVNYWNLTMAASMFFTLPAILVFVFFNRFFVKNLSFTGGK